MRVIYRDDDFYVTKEGEKYHVYEADSRCKIVANLRSHKEALEVVRRMTEGLPPQKTKPEIVGVPPEHIVYYGESPGTYPFAVEVRPVFVKYSTGVTKLMPRHLVVAHELGHQWLGHDPMKRRIPAITVSQEEEAWREAARSLRRAGEWTPHAREAAAQSLAAYYRQLETDIGINEAREFVEAL